MPDQKLLAAGRVTLRKLHRFAASRYIENAKDVIGRAHAILLDETADPDDAVEVLSTGLREAQAHYQTEVVRCAAQWRKAAEEQDRISRMARVGGRRA
ncbi:MAG: hypothetical protein JSV86_18555 [Gemmatimonadota bacterium]|nr:MAG: hypothetical protein JSV86_18555 [Gemmatimonadota bacterium]